MHGEIRFRAPQKRAFPFYEWAISLPSISAMRSPMTSEAVAAGEGTFTTLMIPGA